MTEKLKAQLIPVLAYIKRNNLEESLTKCQVQWQQNVVKYIRAEYGYDQICNLPYATLWDVLSTEELNLILADESLFTAISPDDAMHIIDMIATAISNAMTAPQLTASV
jgi:hypothetical protein